MMHYPNQQDQINQKRYDDMVRFAEQHERTRELTADKDGTGFYKPALASIGKVLSNVGEHLQTRYGEPANNPDNTKTTTLGNYQLETAK